MYTDFYDKEYLSHLSLFVIKNHAIHSMEFYDKATQRVFFHLLLTNWDSSKKYISKTLSHLYPHKTKYLYLVFSYNNFAAEGKRVSLIYSVQPSCGLSPSVIKGQSWPLINSGCKTHQNFSAEGKRVSLIYSVPSLCGLSLSVINGKIYDLVNLINYFPYQSFFCLNDMLQCNGNHWRWCF